LASLVKAPRPEAGLRLLPNRLTRSPPRTKRAARARLRRSARWRLVGSASWERQSMDGEVSRQIHADWAASHSIWRVKM
jgi:hypothetical protein